MFLQQNLPHVLDKNLNKAEALKDIQAFSAIEGEAGDRILHHLCIKFGVFEGKRSRTEHEAGFDEGVKAVLVYLGRMKNDYGKVKQKLEVHDVR
jgi:NOL1/NOP2/fmu family ribosome biogenesis protein